METNSEIETVKSDLTPGIHQFPIEGYKSEANIFIVNDKPKSQIKNALSKMKIIIFSFNLTKMKSLTFLEEWIPIIRQVDKNDQERILVGIFPKSSHSTDYKLSKIYPKVKSIKEKLQISKYFEYGQLPKSLKRPSSIKIEIYTELLQYIQQHISHIEEEEEEEDKEEESHEQVLHKEQNKEENDQSNQIQNTEITQPDKTQPKLENLIEKVENQEENINKQLSIGKEKEQNSIVENKEENEKNENAVEEKEEEENYEIADNSFIILGQFDKEQNILENDLINIGKDSETEPVISELSSGIHQFPIEGYKSEANIFIVNDKPKSQIKNALSKMKIIIFSFNLTKMKSLTFLEEWIPIIRQVDKNDQERILVGIFPKSSKSTDYKLSKIYPNVKSIKEKLQISKYFEYGQLPKSLKRPQKLKINICNGLISYIQKQLQLVQNEEEDKGENPNEDLITTEKGVIYKLSIKDKKAEIFQSQDEKKEIEIPKFIEHESELYKVVQINSEAFLNSAIEVFKMINDENITISQKSFENCISLRSITIKTNETIHIKENNFNKIPKLESIYIKGKYIIIDNNCFTECFVQEQYFAQKRKQPENKIIIIEGLNQISIGNACFKKNDLLEHIELKSNQIIVGDDCFDDCRHLSSFTISESNEFSLGKNQFRKCLNLQKLKLVSTKIDLGIRCFSLSSLTEVEIFGEEITINKFSVSDLSSITKFSINKSKIVIIDENAFRGCQNLKIFSVVSEQTLIISNSCFINLKSLQEISITCPIILIEESCFMNCKSLSTVKFEKVTEYEISNQAFSGCESLKELSISSYQKAQIKHRCFSGCKNLSSIKLSSEEIIIDEFCFENCPSLLSLTFPEVRILDIKSNSFKKLYES